MEQLDLKILEELLFFLTKFCMHKVQVYV